MATNDDYQAYLRTTRWLDWRNERFVYGFAAICAMMTIVSVTAFIALGLNADKCACALATTTNEFCMRLVK